MDVETYMPVIRKDGRRMIDKDELLNELEFGKPTNWLEDEYLQGCCDQYKTDTIIVRAAPEVECIEVVRCKNCTSCIDDEGKQLICAHWISRVEPDGYCYKGVRAKE